MARTFRIVENPPQRMNDRIPSFRARSDLETLLSSPGEISTVTDRVNWALAYCKIAFKREIILEREIGALLISLLINSINSFAH